MFPGGSTCIFNAPMSLSVPSRCSHMVLFTLIVSHLLNFSKRYLITGTHAARRVQTDLRENSRVMHAAEFWAQQG